VTDEKSRNRHPAQPYLVHHPDLYFFASGLIQQVYALSGGKANGEKGTYAGI